MSCAITGTFPMCRKFNDKIPISQIIPHIFEKQNSFEFLPFEIRSESMGVVVLHNPFYGPPMIG